MTKLKELIGIMKDKASQGKAAILSKRITLYLLRATSHDSFTPPTHKHISTLLSFGDGSRATASAAVELLMNRLQTTQNSAVALKCLIAVHHIIKHGTFILKDQLSVFPSSGGRNYLNLSNFRDKSTPISWELSSWVRCYAKHVEQLLCTSRILGFFLSGETNDAPETREERASGLTNGDLLRETEALLVLIEGVGEIPESGSVEENKLVGEIVGLVEEDGVAALSEVCVRVNEFRERLGCLCFGEVVELVYAMKRLEGCKEKIAMMKVMVEVAEKMRMWDSVRELKEKVENMEEGKLYRRKVTRHVSDRFAVAVLSSVDLVQFRSTRFWFESDDL
ncbi:putative clathrin assembly protein At4g40080 [Abrus precatorius]|uniref:Clathrin assembly protein At4g40080 n=1 Tax=Abrus precatorius TaxID=3816 RepID=A0A8B8K1F4_ABRPR|nr:putative clathrin assembly protein At4g40080 [Abrus precatorius]